MQWPTSEIESIVLCICAAIRDTEMRQKLFRNVSRSRQLHSCPSRNEALSTGASHASRPRRDLRMIFGSLGGPLRALDHSATETNGDNKTLVKIIPQTLR